MEVPWLIMLVLFINFGPRQRLVTAKTFDEKLALRKRLELINKPAIKSFKTEHGDIFDCVEIHKQLAFDHPLLKNHSIQMKPSFDVLSEIQKGRSKQKEHYPSIEITPKNMRCPKGTVIVKRVQEEELIMDNLLSSIIANKHSSAPHSSKFSHPNENKPPIGNQLATVTAYIENAGVSGTVNVWAVDAKLGEYSDASIYIANEDNSVINVIQAGWAEEEIGGKVTAGCFNTLCPGFVQVSTEYPLGFVIHPLSTYDGEQYIINVSIKVDTSSKYWWVIYGKEPIGYWPPEVVKSMGDRAKRAGWGGQIYSPRSDSAPAMGNGHFPSEGFRKSCYISELALFAADFETDDLEMYTTKPDCYQVRYDGQDNVMAFGGPANCQTT